MVERNDSSFGFEIQMNKVLTILVAQIPVGAGVGSSVGAGVGSSVLIVFLFFFDNNL